MSERPSPGRPLLARPAVRAAGLLALLAYLPALTAAPGRMPTDSKLYLYLDPGRFLGDAASSFDPNQFAGWVPHQHVAYLWPAGPWFWLFDTVGVSDWIAHRLWIGSLMLAAGLGVRWCARELGCNHVAALVAAVVYQASPYVLPYVSRTSVMLLPWAGVGWIVGLTIRATRERTWRAPAWIALVVFTVGAVNATALAMIVPAPTLWLVHTVWQRSITWRQAITVAGRVAVLTVPACVWWIAMLVIQGRYGAEVLPYSESLADVSLTATGPEVWRSLGYWLFYVRDPYAATTAESLRYLSSTPAIAFSYLVPIVGLVGLAGVRWAHRRFAALLVGAGAVLAVGVHPIGDRSPLMRVLAGSDDGGLALALRSSTRALPVMNLGLALGAGAVAMACSGARLPERALRLRTDVVAGALVIAIAVVNLPALWNGAFVDPALERDQDPPAAWLEAAAALDASGREGRVLQVPGAEFGAFRWGYTVDQPLAGLTEKPLITRDLLPLGSPGAMDLLDALDDRMQDGIFEPTSLAAVSRWLGVDTIWVANDLAYDRFRTARPEIVAAEVAAAPGVADGVDVGDVTLNRPEIAVTDERSLGDSRAGTPHAPVTLHALDDPGRVVRAGDDVVLVSGSGDGLVDLAAAGLLDGTELVRYTASLDPGELAETMAGDTRLLVTDSNRDRARHWRSSQDTLGYTESDQDGLDLLREVASDQRLPVFGGRDEPIDPATQTVARQVGPVTATATSYGEPFAYLPEHRPYAAIDGDDDTAWIVGEHADPVGETLRLRFETPVSEITLVQPDPGGGRRITEVRVEFPADPTVSLPAADPQVIPLDEQTAIALPAGTAQIDVTVTAVAGGEPFTAGAVQAVGFAEVVTGLAPAIEVVRPPIDGLVELEADTPLTVALTRLRVDPMDRWRDDPEPVLVREIDLRDARSLAPAVDVRLDTRAGDAELAAALGWPAVASTRLTGSIANAGVSAIDGNPGTSWITGFGAASGATLRIEAVAGPIDAISVQQPVGGFSTIAAVTIRSGGQERTVELVPDAAGTATATVDPPLPGGTVELVLTSVEPATTLDRRFGDPVELPAAISEVSLPGLAQAASVAATSLSVECAPLLDVDGEAWEVSVTLTGRQAIDGAAAAAEPCAPAVELAAGTHRITGTSAGLPITVDRVVLASTLPPPPKRAATGGPSATVVDDGRFDRTVEVTGCTDGCWLVLGEGHNLAWSASIDGRTLGEPELVDGGFNGWWLEGAAGTVAVDVHWGQQRQLDIAFLISIVGVLAAAALVVAGGRRRAVTDGAARTRRRLHRRGAVGGRRQPAAGSRPTAHRPGSRSPHRGRCWPVCSSSRSGRCGALQPASQRPSGVAPACPS